MKLSKFASALFALSVFTAAITAHADEASQLKAVQTAYNLREGLKHLTPEEAKSVQGMVEKPKACLKALDAFVKAGKSESSVIKLAIYGDVTIGDARKVCEQLLIDAGAFEEAVGDREEGERAAIEQKYKDAGFKGDRLKLFVDNELNGGGFAWYGKGCKTEITDLKALKKAKKLFNWTNGANGGTLVTKCTFKGDKVKCVSKEFFKEKKAYAYCR